MRETSQAERAGSSPINVTHSESFHDSGGKRSATISIFSLGWGWMLRSNIRKTAETLSCFDPSLFVKLLKGGKKDVWNHLFIYPKRSTWFAIAHWLTLEVIQDMQNNSRIYSANSYLVGNSEIPLVGDLTFHQLSLIIGGSSAGLAILLNIYLIWIHALNYTKPYEQRQ